MILYLYYIILYYTILYHVTLCYIMLCYTVVCYLTHQRGFRARCLELHQAVSARAGSMSMLSASRGPSGQRIAMSHTLV